MVNLTCTNCGFENPPGMRFCGNCGSRLPETDLLGDKGKVRTGPLRLEGMPEIPPGSAREYRQNPWEMVDRPNVGVMSGPDLVERFKRAGLEASGQRRSVTVLFVDLTGYTHLSEMLSDEVLYELIQKYIRVLADDVYKYEGMVDKFTGDGLMALFGAPIAHENNAERALRAALDMQEDVARLNTEVEDLKGQTLRLHIGLNAGSVIVGGLGNDAVMNYTAIGDSVNLARRLEEVASPGTIFVSESVYRQTGRLFDFEVMPAQPLKGISRQVTAYRVLHPKEHPASTRGVEGLRAPMIGRETEMRQLRQMVHRLSQDHLGGAVLVVGEAGIGKSRLTLEMKSILDPTEVHVLEGRSLTYRKAMAYWMFQDILRGLLDAHAEISEGELRQRLLDEVKYVFQSGQDWRARLPYLEYLLALEPSDPTAAQGIHYLDASQLRQQIFLAVRDLIEAEAERKPLLLILEDLHWADDASVDLLQFLLDSTRRVPLLIYAISRPFEGGVVQALSERAKQRLSSQFVLMHLQSLSLERCTELFFALLTVPDLPESLRKNIISRAAGSPFYLEEILRMMIEDNVIYRDGENWRMSADAEIDKIGVPETLQDLILTRFDRLSPLPRQVLQTAAVIGYQFNARVLKEVLVKLPANEIQSALDWLTEREYIQSDMGTLSDDYTFKHVLVSDAVYSTLLQRDRRDLHSDVAEAIEKIYIGKLDGQIELLANHYQRSAHLDRALAYTILAGQKAARDFANEQARQHFVQALGLLARVAYTPEQAFQIHLGVGNSLVVSGEYQAARDHYQSTFESLDMSAHDDIWVAQMVSLQRKIATTFERQGDYEKSLLRLYAAQDILERDDANYFHIERASVLNDIGWIYSRRGKFDEAEKLLQEALSMAEKGDQIDLIASIYNRLGGIFYHRDELEQASSYLSRSLELREKIGDIVNVARSYNNLGLLKGRQGNLDGALESFNRAFRLQSNLGDVEALIELHINMGLVEIDRGEFPSAEKHFEEALITAEQIGHSYFIGYVYHHLSLLYLYEEKWQAALDNGRLSQDTFQRIGVQDHQLDVNTFIGLAYLGLGDLEHAKEISVVVIELLRNQEGGTAPGGEEEGRALRLLAGLAHSYREYETACRHLEKSAANFERVGNRMERARSMLDLADLQVQVGQPERARQTLSVAKEILNHVGGNYYQEKINRLEMIVKDVL